ncbi:hypothetical protein AURDEDRAFT_111325 [Auricularia subglabra TFB-10046 SS5]|nr:hypothetical protein AURDEDRAFT_111325 [Auricularia subglabra TFB-10046 SS5]
MRTTTLLPVLAAVLAVAAVPIAPTYNGAVSATESGAPIVDKRVNNAANVAAVEHEKVAAPVASATARPQKEAQVNVEKHVARRREFAAPKADETSNTTATPATASTAKMALKKGHATAPENSKVHVVGRKMPAHTKEHGKVGSEHEELSVRDMMPASEEGEVNGKHEQVQVARDVAGMKADEVLAFLKAMKAMKPQADASESHSQ